MGTIIGIILVLGGAMGCLHSWIRVQKERQIRLNECIVFLQKSVFAMGTEKVKVMDYFAKYKSQDTQIAPSKDIILERTLHEIAKRLATNTYPKGQAAWEEVLKEEEADFDFDKETFEILLRVGNGFFGRSCEENLCFLQKSINELENQQKKMKERDAQERKIWVPVGMLGAVMLLIIFV